MCLQSSSKCVRLRLCQIATSAIRGSADVPGGLSVTPAVSRGRGEILLTSPLRNTDRLHGLRHSWVSKHTVQIIHDQNYACCCAALITWTPVFMDIQKMHVSLFLSHSPALLTRPPESTCSTELNVPQEKTQNEKTRKKRRWRVWAQTHLTTMTE